MKIQELFESGLTYQQVSGDKLYYELLDRDHRKNKRLKYLSTSGIEIQREFDIICMDGELVVGAAGLQLSPYEKNVLWVMFVSVDPAYQNRGIGKRLAEEVFKYAKEKKLRIKASSYSEMGEAYLKKIFDGLAKKYSDVPFKDGDDDTRFD